MTVCFHKEDKKFQKIFKCNMVKMGLVQVGLCCKMSPRKLVILLAIRRPPYKTAVAPNIYITTCYIQLCVSVISVIHIADPRL